MGGCGATATTRASRGGRVAGQVGLDDGDDLLLAVLVAHVLVQALGILEANAALLTGKNSAGQRVAMHQRLMRQKSLLAGKDLGTLAALVHLGVLTLENV